MKDELSKHKETNKRNQNEVRVLGKEHVGQHSIGSPRGLELCCTPIRPHKVFIVIESRVGWLCPM
jgi:hypothetical protein